MHPYSPTTPACRATASKPRLRHLVHHVEANGTIHALCGLRMCPSRGATIAAHTDKVLCPACDAARHLYEVTL